MSANTFIENAETMSFDSNFFDHVNCQGVIHHTPNTEKAISEIYRVLKPGGTASISVYNKNIFHTCWPYLRWIGVPLAKLGGGLKGRGRENIFLQKNVSEIVRVYDGAENPIGKYYSKNQFKMLLKSKFHIEDMFLHFFPARSLPFEIPQKLHRFLDRNFGFMIYANVKKPCAE